MADVTTADHVALTADLRRLLDARLLGPLATLLPDRSDLDALRQHLHIDTEVWAAQLLGPDDDLAKTLLTRLIAALWPGDDAFAPPVGWWSTPLGRITAQRLGHPTEQRVPYALAGAMLGISRQGVHDLVKRGKLTAHPSGGVVSDSIRHRLVEVRSRDATSTRRGDVHA